MFVLADTNMSNIGDVIGTISQKLIPNLLSLEDSLMYSNMGQPTSGICGALIGVSDINEARRVYSDIFGYDQVVYDVEGAAEDFFCLPGGGERIHRVLLTHSQPRQGGFSKLFGTSSIELVQCLDRSPQKIFKNRLWGDIGFIHLCFDIKNMAELERLCNSKGFPFTVDSNVKGRFDMGDAAGHFTNIEDPDGNLIEFVETYYIPVLEKFNIGINLKKRDPEKALPNFIMGGLRFLRKGADYTSSRTAKEKNKIAEECAENLKAKLEKESENHQ